MSILRKLSKRVDKLTAALREEGETIMTEAKLLTPVDTGLLRASGKVEEVTTSSGPAVDLSFNTDYAEKVHEDVHAYHGVGQAKYLEIPVEAARPGLLKRIHRKSKL